MDRIRGFGPRDGGSIPPGPVKSFNKAHSLNYKKKNEQQRNNCKEK